LAICYTACPVTFSFITGITVFLMRFREYSSEKLDKSVQKETFSSLRKASISLLSTLSKGLIILPLLGGIEARPLTPVPLKRLKRSVSARSFLLWATAIFPPPTRLRISSKNS